MLTAVDGATDKVRMKITDTATGTTVYDNQLGNNDDSDAATAISGGSIVIHK